MKGILILVACGSALGADWPQRRGIHRDGIPPETGLAEIVARGGAETGLKGDGAERGFFPRSP